MKNLVYLSQVAFIMLTPILIGIYVGNYIDEKFSLSPICLLIGVILGVITSFLNLYKFMKAATKDKTKK